MSHCPPPLSPRTAPTSRRRRQSFFFPPKGRLLGRKVGGGGPFVFADIDWSGSSSFLLCVCRIFVAKQGGGEARLERFLPGPFYRDWFLFLSPSLRGRIILVSRPPPPHSFFLFLSPLLFPISEKRMAPKTFSSRLR